MNETQVMVVDDEEIVCDRLKNHLEKDRFIVETFTDSEKSARGPWRKTLPRGCIGLEDGGTVGSGCAS